MSPTLVVVGHGMVGHRLVDAAVDRGLAVTRRVVVHAEEDIAAYDRVGLSSWFDGADLALPAQGHPAVDLRLADPVVAVDTVGRTVTARSGRVTA